MRQNPQEKNVSPRTRSMRVDQFRKFMQKQRRTIVRPPWLVNRPLSNPLSSSSVPQAPPQTQPFFRTFTTIPIKEPVDVANKASAQQKYQLTQNIDQQSMAQGQKKLWPTAAGFSEAWPTSGGYGWLRAGSKKRTTVGTGLPPCCRGHVDGRRYLCLQQDPGVKQRVATVHRAIENKCKNNGTP